MLKTLQTLIKKYGFVFSTFFTFAVILIFHFTRFNGLKLYPVAVNFAIFLVFVSSLFQEETIIQKFAKITEGTLSESVKIYTKVATCFMSDKIWMLYNGFLSYFFLGCFFAIEYTIRTIFRLKNKF